MKAWLVRRRRRVLARELDSARTARDLLTCHVRDLEAALAAHDGRNPRPGAHVAQSGALARRLTAYAADNDGRLRFAPDAIEAPDSVFTWRHVAGALGCAVLVATALGVLGVL